jgi:hypothetical protein
MNLWRGDLSPLGCEAALKLLMRCIRYTVVAVFGAASQPNGDKSPRHKDILSPFKTPRSGNITLSCRSVTSVAVRDRTTDACKNATFFVDLKPLTP